MAKYRITSYPCLVRTYVVEAKDEDEAWKKYFEDRNLEIETEDYEEDFSGPEIEII